MASATFVNGGLQCQKSETGLKTHLRKFLAGQKCVKVLISIGSGWCVSGGMWLEPCQKVKLEGRAGLYTRSRFNPVAELNPQHWRNQGSSLHDPRLSDQTPHHISRPPSRKENTDGDMRGAELAYQIGGCVCGIQKKKRDLRDTKHPSVIKAFDSNARLESVYRVDYG